MRRLVLLFVPVVVGWSASARTQAAQASSASATAPSGAVATAASRHPEEGRPLIRSYRPLEVGGGTQT
jgi:hypothetical protein